MDSKKRMMFSLEDDYYYITLKILLILKCFNCHLKPFIDYRKLSVLFEVIKNDKTNKFVESLLMRNLELDLIQNDRIVDIILNSKLNIPIIKRIIFFLESKDKIVLKKNDSGKSIDIKLIKEKELFKLLDSDMFNQDRNRIMMIKKHVPRARYIKFTTLKEKLFGENEVNKWDD